MKLLSACLFGLVIATSGLSLTTAVAGTFSSSSEEECPDGYHKCYVNDVNVEEFACCPDLYCYELDPGRLDCVDFSDT